MAFWWYRRRKPWFGRWRTTRRKKFRTRRRRARRPRRHWHRRTHRRRRRRYRKVRRKRKAIILKQWQPESIRKCKIKGSGTIVLGANGAQMRCYTTYKSEWTNPKTPTGGGFGVELITLSYLYSEHKFFNNIWTSSNDYYDLCRYTGGRVTFYRHPETDFIIAYDTQPPFDLNKFTYMYCHPYMLMQRKRKKFLLSTATAPNGKLKKTIKFKPPKQLVTKWMFQEDFAKYGLVTLIASAANLRYPNLTPKNENLLISLWYLQADFYKQSNWANASETYKPYSTVPTNLTFYYYDEKNAEKTHTITQTIAQNYQNSVNLTQGWFNTNILKAFKVTQTGHSYGMTPCGTVRYNPVTDNGKGNKMWLTSIVNGTYNVPKDEDLIFEDYPLWLMLYGFTSFLRDKKHDESYFSAYILVIRTDKVYRTSGIGTSPFYIFLDKSFINGKGPYNQAPNPLAGNVWYPSLKKQLEAIQEIVMTGPYIPKYGDVVNSTWECSYTYDFYLKWGGSFPPEPNAEDPSKKGKYDVPDKQQERLQIKDPTNQKINSILRTWDYRRGQITNKALKRMYADLETDETLSTDSDNSISPAKKKKLPLLNNPTKESQKIQTCLQELFKENISPQEEDNQDILQLIQQQHLQQQQLKHNLLTLITDLKHKQRTVLHQQGMLF
nr:MAG: ORF1 [Torque teno midi virus]